jgi:hypothetical protein
MNIRSQITRCLAVAMTVTCLLGSQVLLPAAQIASSPRVIDVSLTDSGSLSGTVIDSKGQVRAKTLVEVRRGRIVVARTLTDQSGRYSINNLPGGLYQVRVDGTETLIRAWAVGTAPPSVAGQLQVVADSLIVRGQDKDAPPTDVASDGGLFGGAGMSTTLGAALIVGGVIGAILIIDELDDDDDDSPPASP